MELERPTPDDYGEGEIVIWVPEELVEITQEYATHYIESNHDYKGYSVIVEAYDI